MVPKNYKVNPDLVPVPGSWKKVGFSPIVSANPVTGSRRPLDPMTIDLVIDVQVPTLVLMINPDDFSLAMSKVIEERRVRGAWSHEHWGNELDKISASGTSAAFFVSGGIGSSCVAGLTRYNRRESAAFQNIRSLEMFYRNNGYNFVAYKNGADVSLGGNLIETVGLVDITFRNKLWRGRFDDFSLEEAAEKPFSVSWSFTFVVHEQCPAWIPDYTSQFLDTDQPKNGPSVRPIPSLNAVPPPPSPDSMWASYSQAIGAMGSPLVQAQTPPSVQGGTKELQRRDLSRAILLGVDQDVTSEQFATCNQAEVTTFVDFQSVENGSQTLAQVTQGNLARLDVRVARDLYNKLRKILQLRQNPQLNMRTLFNRFQSATGVLDLTGLVPSDPQQYILCAVTSGQNILLREMI